MRQLIFPSGRRELTGRLFDHVRGGATRRAVLFVHGQGSSQESYKHRAEVASASLEAVCLTFNLSGHGKDIGDSEEYSVVEHLDDVVAAFDFLASHPAVDRTRIGVCGASYGAYLAALLTAHRNFRSLILRALHSSSTMIPQIHIRLSLNQNMSSTV
jgi:dipeptidyl aminopeptidase/acylaminoacyl peptidase